MAQELVGVAQAAVPTSIAELPVSDGDVGERHVRIFNGQLQKLLNGLATLAANLLDPLGSGKRERGGQTSVTGTVATFDTGLTTVSAASVTVNVAATTDAAYATCVPSATPGAIDIYVWKTDGTAATVPVDVSWSAYGT